MPKEARKNTGGGAIFSAYGNAQNLAKRTGMGSGVGDKAMWWKRMMAETSSRLRRNILDMLCEER